MFNEIGNTFNNFFMGIMEMTHEDIIVYFTERELIALIIGVLAMMIFMINFIAIQDIIKGGRKNGCEG